MTVAHPNPVTPKGTTRWMMWMSPKLTWIPQTWSHPKNVTFFAMLFFVSRDGLRLYAFVFIIFPCRQVFHRPTSETPKTSIDAYHHDVV